MNENRLCRAEFQADMQLGLGWYSGLKDALRTFNIRMPRSPADFDLLSSSRALKDKYILQGMTAEPDSHLQLTYFSLKTEYRCEPYITQSKSTAVRSTIARFRTGCHDWLQVGMGRHRHVDYEERGCPSCPDHVEDEIHAIFHGRSFTLERLIYEDLFDGPECLRSFLVSNPPHRVAKFLEACRAVRLHSHQEHVYTVCSEATDIYESD